MPLNLKTPEQVIEDRQGLFCGALAALWSEQAALPKNKNARLGIVCDERRFIFSVEWMDGGVARRKETYLYLHEASNNVHMNFTTMFRTLTQAAGLF